MIPILHADEALLAVDKPAGRLVIPGRNPSAGEPSLREELASLHGPLWVVHRLDRGTTGVLVFARSAGAHRTLCLAFEHRGVTKRYLALVRGSPPDAARIDVPIAPARRGRMRPAHLGDPRGKSAVTAVRVLERFAPRPPLPALALVEALPETGRTHQLRVHLAHGGTPLAVDPDYGEAGPLLGRDGAVLIARTPLHAVELRFAHPLTGKPLALAAPLPEDLARTLQAARGT